MIKLVIKDFLLQKKFVLFALGYSVFLFFAFQNPVLGNFIYAMGSIAIAYIFSLTSINYDEKNKTEIILNSLPVKREHIIISKYLTLFASIAIALAIMGSMGVLFSIIGFPKVSRLINMSDVIITFLSVTILMCIYYPLYLKIGGVFIKFANVVVFMMAFFLPANISRWIIENQDLPLVQNIYYLLSNSSPFVLAGIGLSLVLILVVSSMLISIKIYREKEF